MAENHVVRAKGLDLWYGEHHALKNINIDIPEKQISDALADGLAAQLGENDRVMMPRSAIANNNMLDILAKKCPVDDIKIYDTRIRTENESQLRSLLATGEVEYIPFTSASTVDGFVQALNGNLECLKDV